MKKFLTFLALACFMVAGVWAQFPSAGTHYVTLTNKDSGKRPYIHNALAENDYTLQSANPGTTNDYIWKVVSDGNGNITSIVNGDGRGVGVNGQYKGRVTSLQYTDKGDGYYYLTSSVIKNAQNDHECLNRSNGGYATGNGWTVTTWKGENNADNQWKVETVDVSALNVYNVVVNGAEGYVTYSTTNEYAYNGGFFLATGTISEADLEVYTIPAYNSSVSVSGNTITITYTADQSQLELNALIAEAEAAYADNDEPLAFGDNLITATSQFDSNATETREGNIGNLLDGNLGSYWHSSWAAEVAPHVHYLQVSLTEPISGAIKMTMGRRSGAANDHPVEMTVEYSADNSTYTLLPGSMKFSATTGYVTGTFTLPTNAQYLRFFNEKSNGSSQRGYWHCSEFQLNKVTKSNNIDNPTAAAAMQEALATAKAITSGATQADVQALQNALNTYKATVDPVITTITWELYDGTTLLATDAQEGCKKDHQYTTTITVPYGYLIEGDKTVTATDADQTITLNRVADPNFPVKYAESYDKIEHWYALNIHHNNKHYVYYSDGATPNVQADVTTYEKADEYAWGFVGNPTDGFVIYNRASGTALYSADNNTSCTVEATGSTFKATLTGWGTAQADGGFCLNVEGQQYVNFQGNQLKHWSDNDSGSTFHAIEIDFSLDAAYKEAKAAALQALTGAANIDLYAATDIATANSAIDGITYNASNETSINAAIATLDGIMDTFYATADGKKFALVSKNDWSTRGVTRYLTAADNTTDRLTAAENVELFSVFTATYDATQNAYKVATAYKPAIYLPVTGNASSEIYASETPGYYTFVGGAAATDPAMISCISSTVSNSQGGIHLDGGKNIVVWGPDGAASKWAFELVSDTDYEALVEAYESVQKTYSFIITDADGYTYEGTYTSEEENARPACVEGFTLSNEKWEEGTDDVDYVYTADFEFPFPVSYDGTDGHFTYIYSFKNTKFAWQAEGTTIVKTVQAEEPSGENFVWAIIPAFKDGAFTYKVMNIATQSYIYSTNASNSHDAGIVTLEEVGSDLTYSDEAFVLPNGYYLSLNSSNKSDGTVQYVGTWGSVHGGVKLMFEEYVPVTSINITIGATGYATIAYYETIVNKPEGLKVYYCTEGATSSSLNTVEWDKDYIPGYGAYILEGTPNTTYTVDCVDSDTFEIPDTDYDAVADIFYNGVLYGNFDDTVMTVEEAKTVYGENIYVFSQVDNIMGFYKYAGTTLAAHKAFYATENASINGFSLDFGGQTVGVNSVISATNLKAGYDIQGRRINKIQKGINILNGKKIIK